jgi:CRP-like cAMP-binding protein
MHTARSHWPCTGMRQRFALRRHWAANEVILGQGSRPTHMFILIEGRVAVAMRDTTLYCGGGGSACGASALKDMALLEPGDTFGEVALMVSGLRSRRGGGGCQGCGLSRCWSSCVVQGDACCVRRSAKQSAEQLAGTCSPLQPDRQIT